MKFTPEVVAAFEVLRAAAETDFERHRLDVLERDLHEPPAVEIVDDKHQRFNGTTFLKQKSGHYHCSLGIHVAIWQYCNGKIPADCVIHHIDENPENNNAENLQLMTRAEHGRRHPPINTAAETRKKFRLTCSYCGKTYETVDPRSKYCSRSCMDKTHRLRMMETRTCIICRHEFKTDKRFDAKCCSNRCAHIWSWQKRKQNNQSPIKTSGEPCATAEPQLTGSPTRPADLPFMKTVDEP